MEDLKKDIADRQKWIKEEQERMDNAFFLFIYIILFGCFGGAILVGIIALIIDLFK